MTLKLLYSYNYAQMPNDASKNTSLPNPCYLLIISETISVSRIHHFFFEEDNLVLFIRSKTCVDINTCSAVQNAKTYSGIDTILT